MSNSANLDRFRYLHQVGVRLYKAKVVLRWKPRDESKRKSKDIYRSGVDTKLLEPEVIFVLNAEKCKTSRSMAKLMTLCFDQSIEDK